MAQMKTLRRCAATLLLAVPTGISATAVAQTDQISVDREACINSNDAAAREAVTAACTRLLDALAREITGPEGAAVHVARGNLYAVRGEADLAIADYDRAIILLLGRLEEALADCKLGRFEQAIADYDAALARNPRDPGRICRAYSRTSEWSPRALHFSAVVLSFLTWFTM
jgi:tetratricopeptide (TPR) repeat protein